MSITYQVLGNPGQDNALYLQINKGTVIHRLLCDCGEGCVNMLKQHEIQSIDHLFFSHLHMDHVGGFDTFFRGNFNREARPNHIWGPPETARIMHHRFQGYLWNLLDNMVATWHVNDVHDSQIERWHFLASEGFSQMHFDAAIPHAGVIVDEPDYTVESLRMDHITPSLAYVIRESQRVNVNTARLEELGLRPGEWLRYLKERRFSAMDTVTIGDVTYDLVELRRELLIMTPGDSIAYLTDFLLDETAQDRLAAALHGCTTVICECQYRNADAEMAQRHHHMTPADVATLAKRADIGKLILFHISERYPPAVWLEMLAEARAIFPNTYFPEGWEIR
jgi:ribonuclease Z